MPKTYSGIWVDRIEYSPTTNLEIYGADEDVMMVRTLDARNGRGGENNIEARGIKRTAPNVYVNASGMRIKWLPNGGFVVAEAEPASINGLDILNKINQLQYAIRH